MALGPRGASPPESSLSLSAYIDPLLPGPLPESNGNESLLEVDEGKGVCRGVFSCSTCILALVGPIIGEGGGANALRLPPSRSPPLLLLPPLSPALLFLGPEGTPVTRNDKGGGGGAMVLGTGKVAGETGGPSSPPPLVICLNLAD